MPVVVAPSILSADPLRFLDEIKDIEAKGADWHHVDVMDGHFVPNLTYGLPLVSALKKESELPLDVHIMVANPDQVALDYISAGADRLSFHVESACHHHRLLTAIRKAGAAAGVAINPGTSLECLQPLLELLDSITIMSVNPGFGGQKFIHSTVERVSRLRGMLAEAGRDDVHVVVDGGINCETGSWVVEAGSTALVAGSYIYNSTDRGAAIHSLKTIPIPA